jgi:CO/xanthine dehydrogenase Mo-binding subunit
MSIKNAAQAAMKKAVQIAPDAWMPGGKPDPLIRQKHGLIGTPVSRLDGPQKVSGTARFAAEFPMESMVYAALRYCTIEPGFFQGEPLLLEIGDADASLAAAPHKVDVVYRTPRHSHNPIELHAATVGWNGDDLVVHDASQCVTHVAWSLAEVFGIKEEQVHVASPYVGGGFGSKTLWQHQILAAATSKLAGRPVRLMLSREGVYRIVGGRTLTEQRVAIGAQAVSSMGVLGSTRC